MLDFFLGDVDFDGAAFSSVIHVKNSDDKTRSVEFFFPVRMLRCFASYDSTGQLTYQRCQGAHQRRTQLDLQLAEGKN